MAEDQRTETTTAQQLAINDSVKLGRDIAYKLPAQIIDLVIATIQGDPRFYFFQLKGDDWRAVFFDVHSPIEDELAALIDAVVCHAVHNYHDYQTILNQLPADVPADVPAGS